MHKRDKMMMMERTFQLFNRIKWTINERIKSDEFQETKPKKEEKKMVLKAEKKMVGNVFVLNVLNT